MKDENKIANFPFPSLIAHRGASWVAPENTLPALTRAAELGALYVECDIQLAATGEAVIFHDDLLNRTTDGSGVLEEQTYEVISKLDAGSWFDKRFVDTRIPLLSQWLLTAAEHRMGLNLEIKVTSRVDAVVATTLQHIETCWSEDLPPLLLSSTSVEILQACYARAPHIPLGLISDEWLSDWQSVLTDNHCLSWHIDEACLNAERIAAVVASPYFLLAYTVNDCAKAQDLLQQGVGSVFSDDVQLLA